MPEPIHVAPTYPPNPFDVALDGQRFVMVQAVRGDSVAQPLPKASVILVENWFEEFRRQP